MTPWGLIYVTTPVTNRGNAGRRSRSRARPPSAGARRCGSCRSRGAWHLVPERPQALPSSPTRRRSTTPPSMIVQWCYRNDPEPDVPAADSSPSTAGYRRGSGDPGVDRLRRVHRYARAAPSSTWIRPAGARHAAEAARAAACPRRGRGAPRQRRAGGVTAPADAAALAAYVGAAARALDLPIAPGHLPGVIATSERLAAAAALVEGLPLGPEVEPAPRFGHDITGRD